MKEAINFCDFSDRFRDMDRKDNFSYEGKKALFDYLEQYEEDTGEEIELDVIALCCEYSEYGSAFDCVKDCVYSCDFNLGDEADEPQQEELEVIALKYLNDNTMVIEFDGGIIIQDF